MKGERSINRAADLNVLLDCADRCVKGSGWKESVQIFEANRMLNCYMLHSDIAAGTYTPKPGRQFIQIERGKTRSIKAPTISDRVVEKAINRAILLPEVEPRLIYDNGASVKGKGNSFGRRRFEAHVHKHFQERGDNGGFVMFGDFSKFFDNLLHERIKAQLRPLIPDEEEYTLFCLYIDRFRQDVSWMSDEEYLTALSVVYNSLDHVGYKGDGSKMLEKGCDIGAEISQTLGIFYPHEMDNFFKCVRGLKYYSRYQDDTAFIGDTMDEMLSYKADLKEQADRLGIFLNEKKTKILPLNKPFTWLKIKYTLTPSGHLIRNISHDAIVRERKRIKYLATQYREGVVTKTYCDNCYLCWRGSNKKYDTHDSIASMDALYRELIGPIDVYEK